MDVIDQPFSFRHSRWRTWMRAHTPDWLYDRGLVVPKAQDCGAHQWHNRDDVGDACYHCEATRPRTPHVTLPDAD